MPTLARVGAIKEDFGFIMIYLQDVRGETGLNFLETVVKGGGWKDGVWFT